MVTAHLFFCASALQAAIIFCASAEVRQGLLRMSFPREVRAIQWDQSHGKFMVRQSALSGCTGFAESARTNAGTSEMSLSSPYAAASPGASCGPAVLTFSANIGEGRATSLARPSAINKRIVSQDRSTSHRYGRAGPSEDRRGGCCASHRRCKDPDPDIVAAVVASLIVAVAPKMGRRIDEPCHVPDQHGADSSAPNHQAKAELSGVRRACAGQRRGAESRDEQQQPRHEE